MYEYDQLLFYLFIAWYFLFVSFPEILNKSALLSHLK